MHIYIYIYTHTYTYVSRGLRGLGISRGFADQGLHRFEQRSAWGERYTLGQLKMRRVRSIHRLRSRSWGGGLCFGASRFRGFVSLVCMGKARKCEAKGLKPTAPNAKHQTLKLQTRRLCNSQSHNPTTPKPNENRKLGMPLPGCLHLFRRHPLTPAPPQRISDTRVSCLGFRAFGFRSAHRVLGFRVKGLVGSWGSEVKGYSRVRKFT